MKSTCRLCGESLPPKKLSLTTISQPRRCAEGWEYPAICECKRKMLTPEERAQLDAEDKTLVYFIRETGTGAIKIGVSHFPESRIWQLQTSHAYPLELMATTRGGEFYERDLHRIFKEDRLMGEWFKPSPRLLAYIEEVKAEAIPSPTH